MDVFSSIIHGIFILLMFGLYKLFTKSNETILKLLAIPLYLVFAVTFASYIVAISEQIITTYIYGKYLISLAGVLIFFV